MANKKDHIDKSQQYQRYLENKMSAKERHAFEMRMLDDDFEREAMEGMEQFSAEEIGSDLNQLKNELHKKTKSTNKFIYWRAAAVIVLLGVFSFFIYYVLDTNSKTEVADNLEIPATEQKESEMPLAVIPDSAKEDRDPIIAYNKTIEPEEDQVLEEAFVAPKVSKIVSGAEVLMDTEADMELTEVVSEDVINQDEKLESVDLPTLAYEPEMAPLDEISSIQEVEAEEIAPAVAEKEQASSQMKMRKAAAAASPSNTRTITGRIRSLEDDEGLPGVNVIVKGSAIGTVTDIEGNYSLEVPENEDVTLVYSSVGYMQEEVEVNDRSEVDVNIEPDVTALSEIVVTGYGTQSPHEAPKYSYTPPRPVDGNSTFRDFVKENLKYPESGLEDKIKGTVKLKFTVRTNGFIANMEVLKSLGDDFDKEAIRLVNEGPNWEPAELNGEVVEREVKVKIRFRVPE